MYFTLLERDALKGETHLLSVRVIVELMGDWFTTAFTREDIIARIVERYRRREKPMCGKIGRGAAKTQP